MLPFWDTVTNYSLINRFTFLPYVVVFLLGVESLMTPIMRKETRAPVFVAAAIASAFYAALCVRAFLSSKIWYLQDWAWPVLASQVHGIAANYGAAWEANGIGHAAFRPVAHVALLFASVMSLFLTPTIERSILIVIPLSTLGLSTMRSARSVGASRLIAVLVGIVGELGPVVLNKLAAGHLFYIISLASLSCALATAVSRRISERTKLLLIACLCGFAVIQIQLYVVGAVAFLVAAFSLRRLPWWARSAAAVAVVSPALPILFSAFSSHVEIAAAPLKTTSSWFSNNSAPFPQALVQLGYAPHYAERALAAGPGILVVTALWLFCALAVVGIALTWRDRRTIIIALVWLLSTFLVLGIYGPFAAPIAWLYRHFLWASAFRELYHFAGIAWLAELLLASIALARLPRIPALVISCGFALGYAMLWWSPTLGGTLELRPMPAVAGEVAALAASPGDWRFLLLPAEWPVGPRDAKSGGTDPLAFAVGLHPSANQYRLNGPLEIAASLARKGYERRAVTWFHAAGVGALFREPDLAMVVRDRFPPPHNVPMWVASLIALAASSTRAPSLGPTCILCAYVRLPHVGNLFTWSGGDAFLPSPPLAQQCHPFSGERTNRAGDPSRGWIAASLWRWLDPRLALMRPNARFTWSGALIRPSPCPVPVYLRVALVHGSLLVDNKAVPVPDGYATINLSPGQHTLRILDGLAAIQLQHRTLSKNGPAATAASASLHYDWRTEVGEGRVPPGTRWIVFKSRFSRAWHLHLSNGRVLSHIKVSGYANGWRVVTSRGSDVSLRYGPAAKIFALEDAGLFAWLAIVIVAIGSLIYERFNRNGVTGFP